MNVARHIGAVLAGLLAIMVITTVTDVMFYQLGFFHSGDGVTHGHYVVAVLYRIVYGVGGGWVTARLAPSRPVRHALVLGGIGSTLAIIGTVAMWNVGPHWYPIAVARICLPCAWLGGHLRESQIETSSFATT